MDIKMQNAIAWRDVHLSQYEIAVLVALSWVTDHHDISPPSPSIKWISDKVSISVGSVKKAIQSLHYKGIIKSITKRRTDSGQLCNEYNIDIAKLRGERKMASGEGSHGEASLCSQEFKSVHKSSPGDNNTINIYSKKDSKLRSSIHHRSDNKKTNVTNPSLADKMSATSLPRPCYSLETEEDFLMWARREDIAPCLYGVIEAGLPKELGTLGPVREKILSLLFSYLKSHGTRLPNNPLAYVRKVLSDKLKTLISEYNQENQHRVEELGRSLVGHRRALAEAENARKCYEKDGYGKQLLEQQDERIAKLKNIISSEQEELRLLSMKCN